MNAIVELLLCTTLFSQVFGQSQTCNDPGTPAEATQVVTNYEVGQELYYTCDRNGYVIEPDRNYTCIYSSGSAAWSDGLEINLPVCVDRTKPEIRNLPTTLQYRDLMDRADVPAPFYSDNFGVKSTAVSHSIESDDIISKPVTIIYTVEDYDNNVQTAAVVIGVIDRTYKPFLNCPDHLELPVSSVSPEAHNVTYDVFSNGTLQFSQEMVTVSVDNIGTYVRIDVASRNEFGTEAYCSFLVTFKAITCFKDTIYPDSNGNRNCLENGDGFICSSKCRTGYIYGDGTVEKNFTCSGQNNWDFNYPHVSCLATESPAYQFTAYVVHDYSFLSGLCLTDYETAIRNRMSVFESQMNNLCAGVQWDITSYTISFGDASTEFKLELTVKLLTTAISEEARTNCVEIIRTTKAIFNLAGGGLFCQNQGQSYSITTSSLSTTSGAFDCITQTFSLIDSDIGKKCIPCGPGQFYYQDGDYCTSCPEGQYQDQQAGTCKTCNLGETANSHKTDCTLTCPPGFVSNDGLLPCTPCGKDYYWKDSMTCTPCVSQTSTSGREGAVNMDGCYSSCPEGEYSRTGYMDWPCKQCPRNFYQPSVGQITCVECPVYEVTDNDGQTGADGCHDYPFQAGESCNRAFCNDHGNCGFQFHRPVCTCDDGYTGGRCDTSFHICDSSPYSPCMNEATCVPGNTYMEYICECREELNIDLCFQQSFTDKEGGNQYNPQQFTGQSLIQCQNNCLLRENCKSLTHNILSSGTPVCLVFDVIIHEANLTDRAGRIHYNRNCLPVYAGDRCEIDLVDECDSSNNLCSDAAMCKDKVLGYECLCPSCGGYQGQNCEQTEEPCDSFPCQNGGSCQNFGNKRYECTCTSGYTGVNCETNIGFPDILISVKDSQTVIDAGNALEISCFAQGSPRSLKFSRWIHLGPDKITRIQEYESQIMTENSSELHLPVVSYMDSGLYICGASYGIDVHFNGSTGAKGEIYIWVKDRPIIVDHKRLVTGDILSNNTLSVLFVSNDIEEPVVVWSKINNGLKLKIDDNDDSYNISLYRQYVDIMYYSVKIRWLGYRADLAINLTKETDYTTYETDVGNSIGEVVAQTVLRRKGIPEAPTDLTVTDIAETNVSLSWAPGFHGGSNQTFILEYKTENTDWSVQLIEGGLLQDKVMNATISDLEPATNYALRITARNMFGTTELTGTSLTVKTLKDTCPRQVTKTETSHIGAIVGGTVGGFLLGGLCVIIIVHVMKFHRNKAPPSDSNQPKTEDFELERSNARPSEGGYSDDKYYNVVSEREEETICSTYEELNKTTRDKQAKDPYEVLKI